MTSDEVKARASVLAPEGWTLLDVSRSVASDGWSLHWALPENRWFYLDLTRSEVDSESGIEAAIRRAHQRATKQIAREDAGTPILGQWVGHGNVRVTAIDTETRTVSLSDGRTGVKWADLKVRQ